MLFHLLQELSNKLLRLLLLLLLLLLLFFSYQMPFGCQSVVQRRRHFQAICYFFNKYFINLVQFKTYCSRFPASAAVQLRSSFFRDVRRIRLAVGTNRLCRNIGNNLPTYGPQLPGRAKVLILIASYFLFVQPCFSLILNIFFVNIPLIFCHLLSMVAVSAIGTIEHFISQLSKATEYPHYKKLSLNACY